MAAEEDGKEPQQVEYQGDHRAAMMAGSGRQINHFAGGRCFGEGQPRPYRDVRSASRVRPRNDPQRLAETNPPPRRRPWFLVSANTKIVHVRGAAASTTSVLDWLAHGVVSRVAIALPQHRQAPGRGVPPSV